MKRQNCGQQGYVDQYVDQSLIDVGVNLVLFWASLGALVVLIAFLVPCLS